jgi:hypothetical protein
MHKGSGFIPKRDVAERKPLFDASSDTKLLCLFTQILFALSFVVSAWFCFNFLSQPILEAHGFRQTQTAITSYYLIKNGFSFSYWTPVLGQEWSVPFEFPIYQQIVAMAVKWLGTPLTNTGRAISWFFDALCCIPVYMILRDLGVDKKTRFFSLALFMSAPLYLFWAGTFMMESTALFFVLWFVFYGIKIANRAASTGDYVLASLFLTLSLLQKTTTGLPIALLFLCFFSLSSVKLSDLKNNKKYLVKTYAAVFFSLLIAYVWVRFSDQVKMENPLGALLSSAAVTKWTFGLPEQRISPQLWKGVIWGRLFDHNLSGLFGLLALLGGLLLTRKNKTSLLILTLLLAGFLPLFIFTNLHIVHSYYQMASGIFLLMALGISVTAVGDRLFEKVPIIYGLLLAFFVAANYYSFSIKSDYMDARTSVINSQNNLILNIADYIKAHTNEDDVVMWHGFEWSSEAPFYAERKSLTVANWMGAETDVIEHTERYLRKPPRAIVLCPEAFNAAKIRKAITVKFAPIKAHMIGLCEIYLLTNKEK